MLEIHELILLYVLIFDIFDLSHHSLSILYYISIKTFLHGSMIYQNMINFILEIVISITIIHILFFFSMKMLVRY
jgi:hypothetical protein